MNKQHKFTTAIVILIIILLTWWLLLKYCSAFQSDDLSQRVISTPDGGILRLDRGVTYLIGEPLILSKPIVIDGNGAIIQYNGSAAIPISIRSSNVTIRDLEVKGTYGKYLLAAALISTEKSSNSKYYENITVENCYVHHFNGSGIIMRYVRNARVTSCIIDSVPYAGIGFYAILKGYVQQNSITNMTAEGTDSGNAYGITINGKSTDSVTRDVIVERNYVANVPWEGLDTHGGDALTFYNNTVEYCGTGIAIVGIEGHSSQNIKITNNTVRYGRPTESGIRLAGVNTGSILGNTRAVVTGNLVVGQHIRASLTYASVIQGNQIYQSATSYGIYASGDNYNISISDNQIVDAYSPTNGNSYAVFFDNNNNTGYVAGNILSISDDSVKNKTKYGFGIATNAKGCFANIGINDFSQAKIEAYKKDGQFASRFMLDATTRFVRIITNAYTVLQYDRFINYEGPSGGKITLPDVSDLQDQRTIVIANRSNGTLTTNITFYTTNVANTKNISAGSIVQLRYDKTTGKVWKF